jgi:D-alanyl-lipoteichoic acid acyltransferase DltB (MBOAT superfamily)
MWTLALAIYAACKWLTWRRTHVAGARWWRHAGYLLAWPGMDARAFLTAGAECPSRARVTVGECVAALIKTALGLAALFGVACRLSPEHPFLAAWVGMLGLVMSLHFGAFHLLSCLWRSLGVDAPPIMNRPLAATSAAEFWGRRWNLAFRDLTHRFLFRPLAPRLGASGAVFVSFLASGLIHEAVITLLAGGGYGGPTAFFLAQGVVVLVQRSSVGKILGLGEGWRGWLFTMSVLLVSAFILFSPPFLGNVVVPFLSAAGAIE